MTSCEEFNNDGGPAAPLNAPRPKFPYLKKGEGTAKRVFASRDRPKKVLTESHSAKVDLNAEDVNLALPGKKVRAGKAIPPVSSRTQTQKTKGKIPQPRRWPSDEEDELAEFTQLERQIRSEVSENAVTRPSIQGSHVEFQLDNQQIKRSSNAEVRSIWDRIPQVASEGICAERVAETSQSNTCKDSQHFDMASGCSNAEMYPSTSQKDRTRMKAVNTSDTCGDPSMDTRCNQTSRSNAAHLRDERGSLVRKAYAARPEPQHVSACASRNMQQELYVLKSEVGKQRPDAPGTYSLDHRVEVQQEMERLRMEREHAASVRRNLEQASKALQQEREAFEAHQANLRVTMEVEREREQEKLRRERANLERQSRTLAKLPTRKERAEIEAMEAVVEQCRKDAKAKDSRHKLTVERLRRQIVSLQDHHSQARDEIQDAQREIETLRTEVAKKQRKRNKSLVSIGIQCGLPAAVVQESQAAALAHQLSSHAHDRLRKGDGAPCDVPVINMMNTQTVPWEHDAAAAKSKAQHVAIGFPIDPNLQHPVLSDQAVDKASIRLAPAGPSSCRLEELAWPDRADMHGKSNVRGSPHQGMGSLSAPDSQKLVSSSKHANSTCMPKVPQAAGRAVALVDKNSLGAGNVSTYAATHTDQTSLESLAVAQHTESFNSRRSDDENMSSEFNVGQLAEIAAIQAELSATRPTSAKWDQPYDDIRSASLLLVENGPGHGKHSHQVNEQGTGVRHAMLDCTTNLRFGQHFVHHAQSEERSLPSEIAKTATRTLAEVCDSCVDACTRFTEHADGKVEKVFADGRRQVCFANGTMKNILPSGLVAVQFANGDMKKSMPNGNVEYFYREVDTWHITLVSGIEVFFFPNGQTEAHHVDGSKEIIFPDGMLRQVLPDGREQPLDASQLSEAALSRRPEPISEVTVA